MTYSPLGKAFKKQTKTIEDQGKKQIDALLALKPKNDGKVKLDKTSNIYYYYCKDRLDEIKKYYEPIDKDDSYIYDNTKSEYISFDSYEDAITLFYYIKMVIELQKIKKFYKKHKKKDRQFKKL